MILGCWLWEPNVASVTTEVARFESLGNILFDNNRTAGGVNKPGAYIILLAGAIGMGKFQLTLLHFRDQLLVEQPSSLLVQRAVDGDYVTLGQHLL